MKIKSSFKMYSGFFKYKLIFTCESTSLLVPSAWQALGLFLFCFTLQYVSSEVPRA